MSSKRESLVNILRNKKPYVKFHPSMLPKGFSVNRIVNALEFLSPMVIILHGSSVSKRKFSLKERNDLDVVCASIKGAFWPLEQLYERAKEDLRDDVVEIDLSIVTCNGLKSIIEGKSSLSKSFNHGFSVLYCEEKT